MKKNIVLLLLIILFSKIFSQTSENLPLDHWAYKDIEVLYLKGYFNELSMTSKPWKRLDIANELFKILEEPRTERTSDYERYLISRLNKEFKVELERIIFVKRSSVRVPLFRELQEKVKSALFKKEIILEASENFSISNKNIIDDKFKSPVLAIDSLPKHKYRSITNGEINVRLHENAVIHSRLQVDTEGLKVPGAITTRQYKGNLAAHFTSTYLMSSFEWIGFLVGREKLYWGPGRNGSLILSDNSPSFNLAEIEINFWKFRFKYFHSILNQKRIDRTDTNFESLIKDSTNANRYFTGHRITFKPDGKFEISFSEVILYGGRGRDLDPSFMNPFITFLDGEFNDEGDNNFLISLDFLWRIKKGIKVYGEFLVDDISLDGKSPHKYAFTTGAGLFIGNYNGNLEYTRITRWVYNYGWNIPWNRYIYKNFNQRKLLPEGEIIGHRLGPDADGFYFDNSYYLGWNITARLNIMYERHGETKVTDSTPVPSPLNYEDNPIYKKNRKKEEKFPYGKVETLISPVFSIVYSRGTNLFFEVSGQYSKISGKKSRNDFKIILSIFYRFRKNFFIFS